MKQRLCIIGNGMAGIKAAEKTLKYAGDLYDITILSEETHDAYNRILLSSVLAGEKSLSDIITHTSEWYSENKVSLRRNFTVVGADENRQVLLSEDGEEQPYDKVLIATGSHAIRIPFPGANLPQVITFRDIKDVDHMIKASSGVKKAVVIGGGLLGLEAAYGLLQRGMDVAVIHLVDYLMERQLDGDAAKLLEQQLVEKGLKIYTKKATEKILGEKSGKVEGISFADGDSMACDLVVMAVGIKPRMDLGSTLGLECGRGIKVNSYLQTSRENFWALGECVEFEGRTFGLVAPLYDMAEAFAKNLAQPESPTEFFEREFPVKLKVSGVNLYSHGKIIADKNEEELVYQDKKLGIYRKLIINDHKVVGVVLLGNTQHSLWYTQLLKDATDMKPLRDHILFGPVGDGAGAAGGVEDMADEAEVCGCNGVTKGAILQAISEKGLNSLASVKMHTKAGTGCGTCSDMVQCLLNSTMDDGGEATAEIVKEGICACTEKDHDEIRQAITANKFTSIAEAMSALKWRNADGCHRCRPALNYYLLCANPTDYHDDRRSRFVNERVHANIQKDGTYSVIPRMFGGMTSVKELRAIADVAEEFNIPTVKVTGGQRIDLLGVKKEDLPKVWGRLNAAGMVSGHAYGKALRTVKTCVGSEWCRFGTQDSTQMGIDLEKTMWGSWTPHKVKLAVSGCPRNCAESTIKDFGVVAVDSGWELYIGGNGGAKVRVADFLCKVETSDEVMEYACAFIQLYREEAKYLDRTAHWIEKVGLSYIEEQIVADSEKRKLLYKRFLDSQKGAQKDPWQDLPQSQYAREEFAVNKMKDGAL